jgi:hypothetical protein
VTETPQSTQQLEPELQAALVNLIIRGMIRGSVDEATTKLVERGLAITKGVVTMPTPQGRTAASEMLRLAPGSEQEKEVGRLFDTFLPINRRLRDICSAWQVKPDGGPNDHTDASYDESVKGRLDEVNQEIEPVLTGFASVEQRLGNYYPELQEALGRFKQGEQNWLASPLIDSYHTVWMHLHQELIMMLGITRAEDEAREERLVSGRAE